MRRTFLTLAAASETAFSGGSSAQDSQPASMAAIGDRASRHSVLPGHSRLGPTVHVSAATVPDLPYGQALRSPRPERKRINTQTEWTS